MKGVEQLDLLDASNTIVLARATPARSTFRSSRCREPGSGRSDSSGRSGASLLQGVSRGAVLQSKDEAAERRSPGSEIFRSSHLWPPAVFWARLHRRAEHRRSRWNARRRNRCRRRLPAARERSTAGDPPKMERDPAGLCCVRAARDGGAYTVTATARVHSDVSARSGPATASHSRRRLRPASRRFRPRLAFLAAIGPATVVSQIYPTGDVVPENQLRLYVHFSGADGTKGGLDYVHSSMTMARSSWIRFFRSTPNSGTTITPVTPCSSIRAAEEGHSPERGDGAIVEPGKRYTLVVDANGATERPSPEATFRRRSLSARPMNVPSTRRRGSAPPPAGTAIRWSSPFRNARSRPAAARPRRRSRRQSLRGDVRIEDGETRWSFTPPEAWRAGTYQSRRTRDARGSRRQPHRARLRARSIRSHGPLAGANADSAPLRGALVSRPRNSRRKCRSAAPRWQGARSENIGHI